MKKLVIEKEEDLGNWFSDDINRVMCEGKLYEFEDYYHDAGYFVMFNRGIEDEDGESEIIEVGRIDEGYYDIYECDGYYEIEKSFIELWLKREQLM